jgi:hypothetical protein
VFSKFSFLQWDIYFEAMALLIFRDQDILYHLALGSESHDLVEMFGDVKFGNNRR